MSGIYELRQNEWIAWNKNQVEDERELSGRRCEKCGTLGFSAERIRGLRRKIVYRLYRKFGQWECQNEILCEWWASKYRDGSRIPEEGFWK